MLILPNKKKAATLIIASMMKHPSSVQKMGEDPSSSKEYKTGDEESAEGSDDDMMGLEAAMDDFLSALDKKDSKAMAKAFMDACNLCENMEPAADDEGEELEEQNKGE